MKGPGTAATSSALQQRAHLHNRLQWATPPLKTGAGFGEDRNYPHWFSVLECSKSL